MGAQGVSTLSMAETTRSLRGETLLKESHRARRGGGAAGGSAAVGGGFVLWRLGAHRAQAAAA